MKALEVRVAEAEAAERADCSDCPRMEPWGAATHFAAGALAEAMRSGAARQAATEETPPAEDCSGCRLPKLAEVGVTAAAWRPETASAR